MNATFFAIISAVASEPGAAFMLPCTQFKKSCKTIKYMQLCHVLTDFVFREAINIKYMYISAYFGAKHGVNVAFPVKLNCRVFRTPYKQYRHVFLR